MGKTARICSIMNRFKMGKLMDFKRKIDKYVNSCHAGSGKSITARKIEEYLRI